MNCECDDKQHIHTHHTHNDTHTGERQGDTRILSETVGDGLQHSTLHPERTNSPPPPQTKAQRGRGDGGVMEVALAKRTAQRVGSGEGEGEGEVIRPWVTGEAVPPWFKSNRV